MCTLELQQLRKGFGAVEIIKGIDLKIDDREFVVFVGPSGSGKSTLLRMIAGLEDITSGELRINGQLVNNVPPDRRGLAMVFQSYALYPHMTVADNMALALRLSGVAREERNVRVRKAAQILQLEALLDRKPANLSGGQRQRVAIGRAIVREPKAFLFDEPLSNLDAALRVQTRLEIAKLHRDLKATMIYVTHDQVEAMTLADRIVVLNGGEIEQVGTPLELYHTPANLFVAGFIGSPKMNLVAATVASVTDGAALLMLNGGSSLSVHKEKLTPGERVTVGIRPEHIVIAPEGSILGRVDLVEHLGGEVIAYLSIGAGQPLTVKFTHEVAINVGDNLRLAVRGHQVSVFDAQGAALASAPANATVSTLTQ
jgi:multiple sugar transport system ATP-binding protein